MIKISSTNKFLILALVIIFLSACTNEEVQPDFKEISQALFESDYKYYNIANKDTNYSYKEKINIQFFKNGEIEVITIRPELKSEEKTYGKYNATFYPIINIVSKLSNDSRTVIKKDENDKLYFELNQFTFKEIDITPVDN